MITFAVVGHDEEATLANALDQAETALEAGDDICFVDSASTDRSAAIATSRGIPVIAAPLGKGNAIAALTRACRTEYVCCLDGDIWSSERNMASELAAAVRTYGDDLVLGDFEDALGAVQSNTLAVYEPLVAALFPEVSGRCGSKPLTGFRAFRVAGAGTAFPSGFGIEAHLNIVFGLRPGGIRAISLGHYRGEFRYKPAMGREIAEAVLDLAESHQRIDNRGRHSWEQWLEPVITHIATFRGDVLARDEFRAELLELAGRPNPGRAAPAEA